MEYEIRQLAGFAMLGLTGGLKDIGALWDHAAEHFADGSLRSADPSITACAAECLDNDRVVYAAGAPCLEAASDLEGNDGFRRIEVPGGRYALVHHRGAFHELKTIPGPLRAALEAAGEQPTGHWLELYRPAVGGGSTQVEIGVLLADG
ncbi:MAG: hypothetical protein EXR66_07105 [Dehalococcoidia bacterium]|nr:hypothetical protein [Dehalococcoidia bacterium]